MRSERCSGVTGAGAGAAASCSVVLAGGVGVTVSVLELSVATAIGSGAAGAGVFTFAFAVWVARGEGNTTGVAGTDAVEGVVSAKARAAERRESFGRSVSVLPLFPFEFPD